MGVVADFWGGVYGLIRWGLGLKGNCKGGELI